MCVFQTHSGKISIIALLLLACQPFLFAGGPKYVAGSTYFNAGLMGQPIHWKNGQLNYFVDQGALSPSLNNQQASAMVDAAAAYWSAVPTAAVALTDAGPLNEDVNGANIAVTNGVITAPADVTPSATAYPLAVVFDYDGTVINAIFGAGASDPTDCRNNVLFQWLDNLNTDTTIAHGVIVLNGLCANTSQQIALMNADLERAFGRILGLDYAQATDYGAGGTGTNWAIMQPPPGVLSPGLNPLQSDDVAALSRIYPVTASNQASFPGKQLTAANTISMQGTLTFKNGVGMQGVNVVARPLDANGNPMNQYAVSFVTGSYFGGNHGNAILGFNDNNGNPLSNFGSNNAALQGFFDLSAIPLPPGLTTVNYQITFEPINVNNILAESVGPYRQGSPLPSGTMPTVTVQGLSAGSAKTMNECITDSAGGNDSEGIMGPAQALPLPANGMWVAGINQVGQTQWFEFPVRGGRTFTIVAQPLNEADAPSAQKLLPSIGVWDAYDPPGTAPVTYVPSPDAFSPGESWLRVIANGNDIVRMAVADQRGDGRPDYTYEGWVVYADTVIPDHLPTSGGPIVINGMGFHLADTVLVGGQAATVTSVSATQITAIAPAAQTGVTGPVDVEVDDATSTEAGALISGGISYDSGKGDGLHLDTAPMGTVPIGVPLPFTVTAEEANLAPAPGVTVTYTVTGGTATLGCGLAVCSVIATGDGLATMNATANDANLSIITASLTNGASIQAQFSGGTPPYINAIAPNLYLAAGAQITWTVQALVLNNGVPAPNQNVIWQPGAGTTISGGNITTSNAAGYATMLLTVGPLVEGQSSATTACVNGTGYCATFTAFGSRPEYATLTPVSGTNQTLAASGTPAPAIARVYDMNGNQMAGATIIFYQTLYAWTPPCQRHQTCTPGEVMAQSVTTAVSAIDGSVTLTPASLPGTATNLAGVFTIGNSATLNVSVEQHP